jgi:hypothetical protein
MCRVEQKLFDTMEEVLNVLGCSELSNEDALTILAMVLKVMAHTATEEAGFSAE